MSRVDIAIPQQNWTTGSRELADARCGERKGDGPPCQRAVEHEGHHMYWQDRRVWVWVR